MDAVFTVVRSAGADDLLAALAQPGSVISQGLLGTANALTAVLCKLTNGQPGDVCTSAAAKAYEGKI